MSRHPFTRSRGCFLPRALCAGLIVVVSAGVPPAHASIASACSRLQSDSDPGAAAPDDAADVAVSAPQFDPAELQPQLDDPLVALPLAAYLASGGDAESALAHLRRLDGGSLSPEHQQRVAEEIERVESWIATRDRFLSKLQVDERKYQVRDGEKRRRVQIERIEAGVVYFAANRWDIESIRVIDLDPLDLAREMGNKKLDFDAGWVRLYIYALCGDKRWKGLLKGDDEEIERLRVAGENDYPVWLGRGKVYAALLDLSAQPVPSDAASGTATLQRVRDLATEFDGRPELEAARPALAQLAECAQYAALASGRLGELFAGEVTPLEEGRVRIVYAFKDAEVMRDFDLGRYGREGTGFEADPESKGMYLEDGALFAEGAGCIRTHATFEGPIEVRYTYASVEEQGGGGLSLGVHDDGGGNCLRAEDVMMLWWADIDQRPPLASKHFEGMMRFRLRVEYEICLKLDDKGKVNLSRSGESCLEMTDCPRKNGAVFIAVNDERGGKFRVSELVIEGKLTEGARESLRRRAAARAAAELGNR
jgi:hypothetical protein